jgi:hypothetical protein
MTAGRIWPPAAFRVRLTDPADDPTACGEACRLLRSHGTCATRDALI